MCGAGNKIVSTICGAGNTMFSMICGTHHSTISSTFPLFRQMTSETWIRKNGVPFPTMLLGGREGVRNKPKLSQYDGVVMGSGCDW